MPLLRASFTPFYSLAQCDGIDPTAIAFINNQNNYRIPGKPSEYLNMLFFDACPEALEQFKMDANASQYRQFGTGTMNPNNPGQIGFMAGSAALAKVVIATFIFPMK